MLSNRFSSRIRHALLRTCVLSALAAPAFLLPSVAKADFDADRDTVVDSADAFPCDAAATSVIFAPAQGHHGFMLFEDQWPFDTDFDFNDVALTYNYIFQVNSAGQVVKMKATLNALAVGGIYDSGVGLQIPVNTNTVASVTKTVGNGAPVALTPVAAETQLTLQLSPNIRELFGNQANQINSDPTRAPMQGQTMVVEITFNTPQVIDTGAAPFDLYIFRSETPSHEIHRPEFPGTRAMDQSLFGRGNDGSGSGRNFIDKQGLPYALVLPEITDWPKEGKPISNIFPNIVNFASSGGRTNQDFYRTGTVSTNMYAPPGGLVRPEPHFIGPDHVPAETGCVQAWGLAVDFGSSRNQFAYGQTTDSQGDIYVTGYVRGSLTGFTNAGGLDTYVAKYDGETGAELWAVQFGGTADETGRDIVVDTNGDIYITGETRSALNGQGNNGGSDAFVTKLNSSGALQWTRTLGGSGQDAAYGVAIGIDGSVFIGGGSTSNNIPGATYPGNTPNSFLAKYSSSGSVLWTTQYRTDTSDGTNYNYTLDIAVDPTTGGVYSVGAERRYSQDPAAAENQFLVKHGSDGSLLWTQHIGDYGYNHGTADSRYAFAYGVAADNFDGSAYVTGYWYGGSHVQSWGDWSRRLGDTSADATLAKFSPSGNPQWTYTQASQDGQDDFGEAVVSNGAVGGVYFAGRTNGSFSGYSNKGGSDYYVVGYDYSGALRWFVQDGTTVNDVGHVAAVSSRDVMLNGALTKTYEVYVIGNTTGALGGPDQGHYDVGIYRRNFSTGVADGTVIASKLGWNIGAWSACTVSCGGGTQSRSVACVRSDGQTVPDSYCPETKPATSVSCNLTPCYTYAWYSGSYGSCSASCGGGTQSRSVYCQRSDGAQVADSYCSGAKPGTTQSCNTQACYTYAWYSGSWGGCSVACGGGGQSRTVYCQRNDGVQVTDSYCTGTKPAVSQSCNTQSCGGSGQPGHWNASCLNLLNSGNAPTSGVYTIDPDGDGGNAPFSVYCDNSVDGGGWTLVMKTYNQAYTHSIWTDSSDYSPANCRDNSSAVVCKIENAYNLMNIQAIRLANVSMGRSTVIPAPYTGRTLKSWLTGAAYSYDMRPYMNALFGLSISNVGSYGFNISRSTTCANYYHYARIGTLWDAGCSCPTVESAGIAYTANGAWSVNGGNHYNFDNCDHNAETFYWVYMYVR